MSNCGGCEEISLPLGEPGVDGKNAFTITSSSFLQPAPGSNVVIQVSNLGQYTNTWASAGQVIFVADSSGKGGWYSVVSTTGSTAIEVTNLNYPGSTPSGETIGTNANVSPSGLQGPAGTAGEAGVAGTNGSQGAAGINGTTLLRSVAGNSTTSTTFNAVTPTLTWTLGTDLLSQNNDKVVIEALFNNNNGSAKGIKGYFQVCMADATVFDIANYFYFSPGDLILYPGSSSTLRVEVCRLSLTSVTTNVTYIDSSGNSRSWGLPSSSNFNIDLSGPISIYINGKLASAAVSGEYVECVRCSVSSYKQ